MTQWVRQCDVRVLVHNHRQDSFRYTVNLDADRIGQIRGRADTLTKCSMLQNAKLRWAEGSKYVVDANMTNLADNVVSSARCAAVCGAWAACNRGAPHVSYATLYLQKLLRCRDLHRRANSGRAHAQQGPSVRSGLAGRFSSDRNHARRFALKVAT